MVEVADSADGGGFVIGEGYGEEVFGAEDDLYGVESHGVRVTQWLVEEGNFVVTRFALHSGLRQSGGVFDAGLYLGLRPRL